MSLIDQVYERIEESAVCKYKECDSEISQFFADRTLFITGVTGFLGKCLLEKLLRSCRKIKHIYILIRESTKETVEERIEKYFQHVVFDRLREEFCDFQKKVTPMKGDLMKEGLGLSDKDKQIIINEVNVIYHNAANVHFFEKVRVSLKVNVLGTKRMLDLARECKHIDAFVYVSTAYSHLYMKNIDEKCYPFAADLNTIHEVIEADEKAENGLNDKDYKLLLGQHPNIYTYTKAFSEELVRQYGQNANFAHIIYRPSIVISTYTEPLPGWWASTLGPVLIFLAGTMGMAHAGFINDVPIDFIPCDLTINALFVTTRDGYNQWKNGKSETLVYNYASSTTNPIGLRKIHEFSHQISYSERPNKAMWYNYMIFADYYCQFLILHVLLHFIPACIADLVILLSGKKPIFVSIFLKFSKYLDLANYFCNGNWKINMPKTLEVINKMNPADKQIFYCDIRSLSWEDYSRISWRGLKKYILKEEISSEKARRWHVKLWYIHYGLVTICALGLCYYILRKLLSVIS